MVASSSSYSLLHADLPVCIGYQAVGRSASTRHCVLPARAESVSAARRFVRDVAEDWRGEPARFATLLENLGIVVSELVTNALLHAYDVVRPERQGADAADLISLCLVHEPCDLRDGEAGVERVLFAVADPSAVSPVAPSPARAADGLWGLDESGRGMYLVEALADDWGWRRFRAPGAAEPSGKVVWALFELAC
ncbi:MAG: ATP-binding protein [Catenulispora sp.]|nr:ATP-binding protein [Catenulispora sp.]